MKKSIVAVLILVVLAGTAVKKQQQPKVKQGICCKQTNTEKQEKKATAPMHYLPVVNFF
jgi:hypothetical protein